MKSLISIVAGFLACVSSALGGGYTSIVHLEEVHSVKVKPGKITIVGTGYVELWVITELEPEMAKEGRKPALHIRAKTTKGTFEIIPYFSDPSIKGIPTGGHDKQELETLSKKGWEEMKTTGAGVRPGDSVTIGYQQDRTTISESQVQGIIGAGSLTINPKPDTAEPHTDGRPVVPPGAK